MKRLFFLFSFSLLLAAATAQDVLTCDTIIYKELPDGNFDLIAGYFVPGVTPENLKNIQVARNKKQLSDFAALERQFTQLKTKLLADSVALIAVQVPEILDSLYTEELKKLAGNWDLIVNDKKDNLSLDENGQFITDKSGEGKVSVLADNARKITLKLGESKAIEMYLEGDDLYLNDKNNIALQRKKTR